MIDLFLGILFGTIITESIVEIVSKAGIFLPLREFLYKKCTFLYDLVNCPFCFSVWTGALMAVCLGVKVPVIFEVHIFSDAVSYFFGGLLLHKLSNFLHDARDRLYYGYDKPLDDEEKADSEKNIVGF